MTWLHGRTESCDRGVTLYLVPGLTSWQRRAVIRRLRQEASRGFGPPLPPSQLVLALGVDRVRTAARIVGSVIRLHPTRALVPSALVAALMTLFVVASASGAGVTPGARGGLAPGDPVADGSASVAIAAAATLATVPGSGPHAGASRSGGELSRAAVVPALSPSAWYVCPSPVSGTAWLVYSGQPARPCSNARAAP